eukprot:2343774-Pleurochrysis_carterae.AAC.1
MEYMMVWCTFNFVKACICAEDEVCGNTANNAETGKSLPPEQPERTEPTYSLRHGTVAKSKRRQPGMTGMTVFSQWALQSTAHVSRHA